MSKIESELVDAYLRALRAERREHFLHRTETEVAEQRAEARISLREIRVMPDPR